MSVFEVKDAHYRQFAKYNQLKKKKQSLLSQTVVFRNQGC